MFSESEEYKKLGELEARGHRTSSLAIHPYFGKVDPSIAGTAIQLLSAPGATVLDPFCGSGTVVHDAIVTGRNAIGWDSSPLAAMVTASKSLGITKEEKNELNELQMQAQEVVPIPIFNRASTPEIHIDIPKMPRVRSISDWFLPNALLELSKINSLIKTWGITASPEAKLLARVAFSRIITSASLQQGESTYRRVNKPDTPGRVVHLFLKSIDHVVKSASAFNAELNKYGEVHSGRLHVSDASYDIQHKNAWACIRVLDSRTEHKDSMGPSANLVVTSPPYLMSWDYGLYHKFRFYWLGFDLDAYEETEIGRHLRRKKDDIPRYIQDMTLIFSRLKSATSQEARAVFVNAPSIVYGVEVDTNKILAESAAMQEWDLEWNSASIAIPGPHHGMYKSLASRGATAPGQAGKTEHVLVFAKRPNVVRVSV